MPVLAVLPLVSSPMPSAPRGDGMLVASFAKSVAPKHEARRAQQTEARRIEASRCPSGMAYVAGGYCVDRYEASLVEINEDGSEQAWPFNMSVEGHRVRAVSQAGVMPQAYISGAEASQACKLAGKRLCKPAEWRKACRGQKASTFPYGNTRTANACNDHGRSPLSALGLIHVRADGTAPEFGEFSVMNHPALNEIPGTLAATGSHEQCVSDEGIFDMVGNLHEWVDDPKGTFFGGYYQDTTQNGDGCSYSTYAHNFTYHDYSTGFRCCADASDEAN